MPAISTIVSSRASESRGGTSSSRAWPGSPWAGWAGRSCWLDWPVLLAGAALGFVLSAVVSLGLLAARRITLRSQICFGPFLLGGALLAVLAIG
jgi:hypothetical protein